MTDLPVGRRTDSTDRAEWRLHWSQKTGLERLAATNELNRQALKLKGIDMDEVKLGWNPRVVRRQSAADELAGIAEVETSINRR